MYGLKKYYLSKKDEIIGIPTDTKKIMVNAKYILLYNFSIDNNAFLFFILSFSITSASITFILLFLEINFPLS